MATRLAAARVRPCGKQHLLITGAAEMHQCCFYPENALLCVPKETSKVKCLVSVCVCFCSFFIVVFVFLPVGTSSSVSRFAGCHILLALNSSWTNTAALQTLSDQHPLLKLCLYFLHLLFFFHFLDFQPFLMLWILKWGVSALYVFIALYANEALFSHMHLGTAVLKNKSQVHF